MLNFVISHFGLFEQEPLGNLTLTNHLKIDGSKIQSELDRNFDKKNNCPEKSFTSIKARYKNLFGIKDY